MPDYQEQRVLSLEAAARLAASVEAEALRRTWTVAVALVDPSGDLILFRRLEGTQPGSEQIAIAKARTAARLRRPTKALEDGIGKGRVALLSIPGALALEGGLPVIKDGHLLGAIGVSGMTSSEDGVLATHALAEFGADR